MALVARHGRLQSEVAKQGRKYLSAQARRKRNRAEAKALAAVRSPGWQAAHDALTDLWVGGLVGFAAARRADRGLRAREAAGKEPPRVTAVRGRVVLAQREE